MDPTELDFSEGTKIFINVRLWNYYRGLWHKCKKNEGWGKLNVFFVSNDTIKVKLLENDPVKAVTCVADLKIFPDIDIDNL